MTPGQSEASLFVCLLFHGDQIQEFAEHLFISEVFKLQTSAIAYHDAGEFTETKG